MLKPRNEMELLILFAAMAERAGWEILSAQKAFPDLKVRKDGITYRAEAEYRAINFFYHGHPFHGCDIIICWENDYPDCPLPILALAEENWMRQKIVLFTDKDREISDLKEKLREAQYKIKRLEGKNLDLVIRTGQYTRNQIANLGCINTVHNMIEQECVPNKIARYIQEVAKEMTDIKHRSVEQSVRRYIAENCSSDSAIQDQPILDHDRT